MFCVVSAFRGATDPRVLTVPVASQRGRPAARGAEGQGSWSVHYAGSDELRWFPPRSDFFLNRNWEVVHCGDDGLLYQL